MRERDGSGAIVEAYSSRSARYDEQANLRSCWGAIAARALAGIRLRERYARVVEVGCGSGRGLRDLLLRSGSEAEFIGIDPAPGMRALAQEALRDLPRAQVRDGRFEALPLEDASVDYLFSVLAFHWTTDVERSIDELARVMRPDGEMDLFFTGRETGKEFTARTTPIFLAYMGPRLLLESARLRKHLTREQAERAFQRRFDPAQLRVAESFETHRDDLEGHWSWWVTRAEGHFSRIAAERRAACDAEIRAAISALSADGQIPYTVHLLHVRLGVER
jgi:ubiquinone/menaquinone biosynthesis C-methylase UbiE